MLYLDSGKKKRWSTAKKEEIVMTDIGVVLQTIEKIRQHCEQLDELSKKHSENYAREEELLRKLAIELDGQMQDRYAQYKQAHLGRIRDRVKQLRDLIRKDYKQIYDGTIVDDRVYFTQDEAANRMTLDHLVAGINECVRYMNSSDFDALVPPERIDIHGEEFTVTCSLGSQKYNTKTAKRTQDDMVRPLPEVMGTLSVYCKQALACLAALESALDMRFGIDGFTAYVEGCNRRRLSELKATQDSAYGQKFNALMLDEKQEAVPLQFFTNLAEDGKASSLDRTTVPNGYRENMTLGDLMLQVDTNEKHLSYFRKTPTLGKYLAQGSLATPLILNLKEKGNILLNINEEVYSDETIAFCNQIIMQFLLSFPPSRINFCMVDIENRMGFSPYKGLTKINNGILGNGIIRDDRQLENTIKDMEQTVYKIHDDILGNARVPDVFEYNRRYEANPQSMHLFVLVNYPSGMRDDIAKRVTKILNDGKKTGVFCLIINNKTCALSPSYKPAENARFLEAAAKESLVINKTGKTFTVEMPHKNTFVPINTMSIDDLPRIIDRLEEQRNEMRQTVVKLEKMFDETDRAVSSPKGIPSSAEVLDIPIGSRGGDIQNLLLKTTGDGSAHTVVIGGTGSGKSNLLHAIILSACYKYSPEELNLYIVDFKGGVEFEYYEAGKVRAKQIPHIKLTGLTSDLEDGVSILGNLHKELRRREEEFKRNQVEDICQYRNLGKKIPRLFVIIDEIQELFEQDDRLGQKAIDILRELFKKGRAFGISILWASQNVPKTPGLKDKVLSQIGNRISLRLNEPDDALDIKIDPKMVKNLNRPEKGLGVINDIRYGNDSMEFRVAYAESSTNRTKYSQMIIDKWRSVTDNMPVEPLYIVGDDAEPSPMGKDTIFSVVPSRANIVSKAFENYILQLGQDYVTGKPYNLELNLLESKMNVLMVGHDADILRDVMGYSLLSLVLNQLTNADCRGKGTKIHCANGDIITPKNAGALFNVIRDDFAPVISNVSRASVLTDCIRNVYKTYKERMIESENSEVANAYAPEIVVIHSLQKYVDLFNENPMLQLTETAAKPTMTAPAPSFGGAMDLASIASLMSANSAAPAPSMGSNSNAMPASISFCNAVKELISRGGKYNIHFIISVDDPGTINAIKNELVAASAYKLFVKGVSGNVLSQLLGDYKASNSLTNPKVAMVCYQDERTKVRMYRFDPVADQNWYRKLCEDYRELMEVMQ